MPYSYRQTSKSHRILTSLILILTLAFSIIALPQAKLLAESDQSAYGPSVPAYEVAPDLSNVKIAQNLQLWDPEKDFLAREMFVVTKDAHPNFYDLYELNTYMHVPNFITVDAMTNAFHQYFAYLLRTTEEEYLADKLVKLTELMLDQAQDQYLDLRGTDFEEPSRKNLAFFSLAMTLQDETFTPLAEIVDLVQEEMSLIQAAQGLTYSPLLGSETDYSQYIVRSHYSKSEKLGKYFKTLIFMGKASFDLADSEDQMTAILMTLASLEDSEAYELWQEIYETTAFFAGRSLDLSPQDIAFALADLYPQLIQVDEDKNLEVLDSVKQILDNPSADSEAWQAIQVMLADLENTNSASQYLDFNEEETKLGFRFMGQRFAWDYGVYSQLIYSQVGANPEGVRRMLPDILDLAAAYGSDLAYDLLDQEGETLFDQYPENMETLKAKFDQVPADAWQSDLASAWHRMLQPLLKEKTEGHPAFMQSEAWAKRDLEAFAGSYTELKHDTVLYSMQAMAEMGLDTPTEIDDRSYVQPEPEVFRRLADLAQSTKVGLEERNLISPDLVEGLEILATMAERLASIADLQLQNTLPDQADFDWMRDFGGNLAHLLDRIAPEEVDNDYGFPEIGDIALVTDIATGDGQVLEIALDQPSTIMVIVPMGDELLLARGVVYDFYQFAVPADQRMTDEEWRALLNSSWLPEDEKPENQIPTKPRWTDDYTFDVEEYFKELYQSNSEIEDQTNLDSPSLDAFQSPDWAEWQELEKTSTSGGLIACVSDRNLDLFQGEEYLCSTPAQWQVQDVHFCDVNQDGLEDLLILCWKPGTFGKSRPFG